MDIFALGLESILASELNAIEAVEGSAVAIGNFDGIHLGHQEIVKSALKSKTDKMKVGVLTFYPHPAEVLKDNADFRYIIPLEERLNKLEILGVDFVTILKFDKSFAQLTAKKFIEEILIRKLKVSKIITGSNFRFGYRREGDLNLLAKYHDFTYQIINTIQHNHLSVSSSTIKDLLKRARLQRANSLLGIPFYILGEVVKGSGKATNLLQKPTANILLDKKIILPKFGVYLVAVYFNGIKKFGMANLGIRPSFGEVDPTLEVHLFDHTETLYGKKLKVDFLSFIRAEYKFENVDKLKAQIQMDERVIRYLLSNAKEWSEFD